MWLACSQQKTTQYNPQKHGCTEYIRLLILRVYGMSVKIYHNPRCSKSRQTLKLIQEQGIEPEIIEYLKNPPSIAELTAILEGLNMEPRELMRKREAEYKETGMDNPDLDKDALIKGMVASPKLIERPIVVANGKVAVGRPPENVLAIL